MNGAIAAYRLVMYFGIYAACRARAFVRTDPSDLLYSCMIITSRYPKGYYTGTAQAAWAIIITLVIFLPNSFAISSRVLLENLYLLDLLLVPSSHKALRV
ncbi:MAG: hypothetical protein C4B59_17595 [Candidatus Methanogaster sp.]|uniref:Uncharacterized protein n=1 Tax=Candidatus Methanogaster sp. TaxID=3386292 RepID=A0AC61KXR8_9EURY|nr:MAG: hypothetical protein C4B59_17595 [ANME-2 cluster archaeon]